MNLPPPPNSIPAWRQTLRDANLPESVVVIDFETYFTTEYSLRKMSAWEYITDERYEEIGRSIMHIPAGQFGGVPEWSWGDDAGPIETLQQLYGSNLEGCTVVAHNLAFDGLILYRKYGIKIPNAVDILGLARHENSQASNDLGSIAERLNIPEKGKTSDFKDLSLADIRNGGKAKDMEVYANRDVDIEWYALKHYLPKWSNVKIEAQLMRHTLGMYWEPKLFVNRAEGDAIREIMAGELVEALALTDHTRKEISGTISFRELMLDAVKAAGDDPDMYTKLGKKNKKGEYPVNLAAAKTDDARELMLNHESLEVRNLINARIGVKSWPNHIKRIEAIKAMSAAAGGYMPVPLKYHGAHCLTGDAEVLTRTGWVRLDMWAGSDIMQWEPSGEMLFAEAEPNTFQNTQPMVALKAGRVRGLFTAGHKLPNFTKRGNFHDVQAGNHPHMDHFPLGGRCRQNPLSTLSVWETRLVVAIQADAHWCDRRAGRKLRWHFKKTRKITRLRVILNRLEIPYDVKEYKDGTSHVIVRHKDIPGWLPYGVKSFGYWGMSLHSRTVSQEVPHWDGNYEKNSRGWSYSSCDKDSAEWVQTHANISGYAASLNIRRKRDPNWSDLWQVFISPCATAHIRKHHWSPSEDVGVVYCPTTTTGYFLVRYGNTIFVSHNTGRWSGYDGVNLQNLGSRGLDIVTRIRGMLEAPAGMKLVVVDAASIEARVLAWLAGHTELCAKFEAGADIYCDFAAGVLKHPVRKPRDNDIPAVAKLMKWSRNSVGKTGILGLGYGMGAKKAVSYSGGAIDLEMSRVMVKSYRTQNKQIVQYWADLERRFKAAAKHGESSELRHGVRIYKDGHDVIMRLPCGRTLRYENIYVSLTDKGTSLVIPSPKTYGKKSHTWGGTLAENITQAVSRDILGEAVLETEAMGYCVVHHCHDEIIALVPDADAEQALSDITEILSCIPEWAVGLPLDAEGGIMQRYGK